MYALRNQRFLTRLRRFGCLRVSTRNIPLAAPAFMRVAKIGVKPLTTYCARNNYSAYLANHDYTPRRYYASKSYPPHSVISMPALSPTMTMGNVGTWQKKVGDAISPGDVLVEIETDKAQMDFECQEEGYLAKILVETGTKDVKIGTPIAILVEEKEGVEQFADYVAEKGPETKSVEQKEAPEETAAQQPSQQPKPATTDYPTTGRIFASPVARRLAHELGISLDQVTGTGPKGRITKADIENFASSAEPTKPEKPITPIVEPTSAYTDVPLSNMRKVIAERLTDSKVSIPHYYLTVEVNMDKVLQLRKTLNDESNGKYKLSVNDFIIKSSAFALMAVPEVNSGWHSDFIRQYHNADISIATATPSGLITPIVKNAQSKGLATISNQVKELAGRAREGKLAPQEYQGGSFTISNMGMFDIKFFTAIINPPQSCILAVGTSEQKLVPDSNTETGYRVVNTMHVTLSCDHRVVDGAVGSRWLKEWRSYIENPLKLLL